MAVSLSLEDLYKHFGSTKAIDGITLTIEPGELFFLLGPSGCGKTTLLRAIAGFNEPDRGRILIGDTDVTSLPPHKRDTGMVFQSYALWPHMSVRENVAFGLQMRNVAKTEATQRVDEALEMVQMLQKADAKPNQLSGGQQQRVALARALVVKPKCLLLDEPLSNLDAKLRLEMRTEIRRICKDAGLTAVYVTHDQKEALSIADRLAVLHQGKVQHCGPPQEVYLRPASKFVAGFIGEVNFIEGEIAAVADGRHTVKTQLGELTSTIGPEGLEPGQKVAVALRPEVLHFNDPPADVNVIDGTVHDSIYLGEVAQHQVAVGDGSLQLKAFDLNPKIIARDGSEQAKVWFRPDDVMLLTE